MQRCRDSQAAVNFRPMSNPYRCHLNLATTAHLYGYYSPDFHCAGGRRKFGKVPRRLPWSRAHDGGSSVTIRKRNEGSFTAANLDLKRFAGRRLRVRGWIEARGGVGSSPLHAPWIEAVYPEQIETADRN